MLKGCFSGKLSTWIWLFFPALLANGQIVAFVPQAVDTIPVQITQKDSIKSSPELESVLSATSNVTADTVIADVKDRTKIDAVIERTARDSIVQDLAKRRVYMYGEAIVTYQDITLKAAYIEIDFNTNTVYASGLKDSTGKLIGKPEFTEGDQTFKSRLMNYNFSTREGIITDIQTEDQKEGYLHGSKVKKLDDNTINVYKGWYSTCSNEEHPHFAFKFNKSRVIPDNKIVTGPVYMEIEGMPTPLGLPFGMFPNQRKRKSGILIPTFGEQANKGFALENGGYYWAISDYMDLQILGDIYSHGSWALRPAFGYKKRYKFSGNLNLGFARNIIGTKGATDYSNTMDYRIGWVHRQDPKARPRSTFSANVNIITSNYVKYNIVDVEDYLSNEFQSSVAYQTNWAGKYFLTLNSNFRQNTKTHQVNLSLPEVTFTVNQFYPLRKEGGKKHFYEDISVSYSMNAKNQINTLDSLLFTSSTVQKYMVNGMVHRIPISLPLKVLKHFTLSNSLNLTDRMYSQSIEKVWADTLIQGGDTLYNQVITDTTRGFYNAFDFTISSSLGTKLYGQLKFKKGVVRAIRHVLTPSIGYAFNPNYGSDNYSYYGSYVDGNGKEIYYSNFEGAIYGSPPNTKSSRLNFSFSNNLEMKVRNRKDTITGLKKITLIERLAFSGNYDFAKDSLNLSYLNVTGNTRLFKNLTIQYASQWDPYMVNSQGRRINVYVWDYYRTFFRWQNTTWNLSFNYTLSDATFNKKKAKPAKPRPESDIIIPEGDIEQMDEIIQNPDDYIDWNVPWSLNLAYTFQYRSSESYSSGGARKVTDTYVQTLALNGSINITPKWKFTFNTGWDFNENALSYTSVNLYRDLHCWEMRFNWIPIGPRKSWNFSINVKASLLQDMKLNRKKDFRDN